MIIIIKMRKPKLPSQSMDLLLKKDFKTLLSVTRLSEHTISNRITYQLQAYE
jgi:hypothetical protein